MFQRVSKFFFIHCLYRDNTLTAGTMNLNEASTSRSLLPTNIHSRDLRTINNNRTNISRLRLSLISDAPRGLGFSWSILVSRDWTGYVRLNKPSGSQVRDSSSILDGSLDRRPVYLVEPCWIEFSLWVMFISNFLYVSTALRLFSTNPKNSGIGPERFVIKLSAMLLKTVGTFFPNTNVVRKNINYKQGGYELGRG